MLALALITLPTAGFAEPTLLAAAGAAVQADAVDPRVATALEAGLALDLGERLRLSLSASYLPDVAGPTENFPRGLWRAGSAVRWSMTGPSRDSGPWLALGAGMGLTTDAPRPFARADFGWSFGSSTQIGAVVSAVRELDGLDRGTFLAVLLRFDGALPAPWAPPAPRVAHASRPPPSAPEPELPTGTPLDPETVRTRVRDNEDDIETCLALATRHGEPPPPRVDLSLVILPGGRVHAAEVHGAGNDLGRCIATRARGWTFPATEGTTRFRAPFVLH